MNEKDTCSPSALRVALAGAWQVVRGRRLRHFPRVLALLEAVGRAAPTALSFQHGVRLRLGLQAAAVHSLLHEAHSEPQLFDCIDLFFPEETPQNWGKGQTTPQEQLMVQEAQQDFRDSILPLLWDRKKRRAYLQGPGRHDYGDAFLRALEQLCFEFLQRLESALPPPDLHQLYAVVWSHAPSGPRPPSLPILQRYLADMGHAPSGIVPRPLSSALHRKSHSERSAPTKPRPPGRQLLPLRVQRLGEGAGLVGDVGGARSRSPAHTWPRPSEFVSDFEEGKGLQKKTRRAPLSRSPPDADRERDRDRHRAHRQGGAHQGARGREGGDPPPAAAAHLQREADERREDGGRLQDPGRLRAAPGVSPARGRGQAGRKAGLTAGLALRPRRRPRPY